MIKVTVYKPEGNIEFHGVTDVKTDGSTLQFDHQSDSTSFGYTKITTSCPYFMEEKVEGQRRY